MSWLWYLLALMVAVCALIQSSPPRSDRLAIQRHRSPSKSEAYANQAAFTTEVALIEPAGSRDQARYHDYDDYGYGHGSSSLSYVIFALGVLLGLLGVYLYYVNSGYYNGTSYVYGSYGGFGGYGGYAGAYGAAAAPQQQQQQQSSNNNNNDNNNNAVVAATNTAAATIIIINGTLLGRSAPSPNLLSLNPWRN